MSRTTKRVIFFLAIVIIIPLVTYAASRYARGERFDPKTKRLTSTGMLVATSVPQGAVVYLDGKLETATDDTLDLVPGEYWVEIKKDGFHPWSKKILIEKEMVQTTDAHLFSKFPSLQSLTFTGAERPSLSPDQQKVVFAVATGSAEKKGLWVLDLSNRPLGFTREPQQLVKDTSSRIFSEANYAWSPDAKEIWLTLERANGRTENFIISAERTVVENELIDLTPTMGEILTEWETELNLRQEEELAKLDKNLQEFLLENATQISFSPDMKRLVYLAKKATTLPQIKSNPLPPSTTQPDQRQLEPDTYFAYDLLEDRNYPLFENPTTPAVSDNDCGSDSLADQRCFFTYKAYDQTINWLSTNRHLFLAQEKKVTILEYDSANWTDVYTGPLENGFAFPFPAGDKILVLATIGESQPTNLYAVSIR